MKLTNRQIINFLNTPIVTKNLPIKLAYAVAANIEASQPALKAYNKKREELVEKHAIKDEKGELTSEFKNPESWNEDINELLDAEAEINITMIPQETLEKCDMVEFDNLSVPELIAIGFMIED